MDLIIFSPYYSTWICINNTGEGGLCKKDDDDGRGRRGDKKIWGRFIKEKKEEEGGIGGGGMMIQRSGKGKIQKSPER